MKYSFRKELLGGKKLIGTIVSLPCPQVTEILCDAGFDWLFAINVADARPYLDQGYALIAVGVETMMLGQAARDVLAGMKK